MSWLLLRHAVLLSTLCTFCGGGGGTAGIPSIPGDRDSATEPYLDEAVSPERLFHWTPVGGAVATDLYVEVENAPQELPPGLASDLSPGDVEGMVRDAVDVWLNALGEDSLYRVHYAFHADGRVHGGEHTVIRIGFDEKPYHRFGGVAELHTVGSDPVLVEEASIQIRIPLGGVDVPFDSYRALMLHEVGHVLGVIDEPPRGGHSKVVDDVMYRIAQWTTLSAGDRATIVDLYRREPVLRRADGAGAAAAGGGASGPRADTQTLRLRCDAGAP